MYQNQTDPEIAMQAVSIYVSIPRFPNTIQKLEELKSISFQYEGQPKFIYEG